MPALTETELSAIIAQQVSAASDYDRDDLAGNREKALDYFFGRMDKYVPPQPNRSKVVDRAVADTIGWLMPQLMRVFTASDRFVEAEPEQPEDVEYAKQATDGLNYVFWKENDGAGVCYDAAWDALLYSDGIVKTYWDDTPQFAISFHSGLTEDQLTQLLEPNEDGNEPEVLASSNSQVQVETPDGPQLIKAYDCKIKRQKAKGRFVMEAIPPEDFLIDLEATCTEDARFLGHRATVTRSSLIAEGYEPEKVRSIPAYTQSSGVKSSRDPHQGEDSPDRSTELVERIECYVQVDMDGDGEAETIRAIFAGGAGGSLLYWEEWEDDTPFDNIPCEPIPHRFFGRSAFDETADIQDVKTVLIRQALNNIYAVNNPQRFAKGKISNPEELMTPSFNGVVFGGADAVIEPLVVPFVANHAFEALAYQDEVRQMRTGVGRQSMALDPEALQNQSATANQNNKDAAYSQVELIARNMAKGWRKVFRKLLKLMIKHQDTPRTIRLRGEKFTTIDPRHWNADMDVSVNVGLGTGSSERDMLMLQQVLGNQLGLADRFMASGATSEAITLLPKIIETMVKIAEAAGLRNPDAFYPDDAEKTVQRLQQQAAQASQQPNPDVVKAQMDAQAKDAQAQRDHDYRMSQLAAKQRLDEIAAQNKLALEKYQTDGELALKRAQLIDELALKRDLGFAQLGLDQELGHAGIASKASVDAASSVHVGGEPG